MSMERARAALERCGLADRIIEFEVSSATVALAAQALGCEPARIAKTLSFARGDGAILVVAAGGCAHRQRQVQGALRHEGAHAGA